jgi:hypothetical protein
MQRVWRDALRDREEMISDSRRASSAEDSGKKSRAQISWPDLSNTAISHLQSVLSKRLLMADG